MNIDSDMSLNRRRRGNGRYLIAVILLTALGAGGVLLYLLVRSESAGSTGGPVQVQSQFAMSTSASSTAADQSRFAASSMEIRLDGAYPLLVQSAEALRAALEGLAFVSQVRIVPPEERPTAAEAQRAADVYVTLSNSPGVPSNGLFELRASGLVHAFAGSQLANPAHSVMDENTPPLVQWDWNGDLEYEVTSRGLDPFGRWESEVAKRIGESVFESLKQHLDGLREKHGLLPELPDAFYGAYTRPLELPELPRVRWNLASTGFGLMSHNETLWILGPEQENVELLAAFKEAMLGRGWKEYGVGMAESPWLRLERNEDTVELYPWPAPNDGGNDVVPAPGGGRWCLRYVDRFERAERDAALAALLAAQADVETLLTFQNEFKQSDLREAFMDRLAQSGSANPQVLLLLAYQDQRRGDNAAALERFRMVVALNWLRAGQGEFRNDLQRLAETLGLTEKDTSTPQVDALLRLGLVPVEQLSGPVSVTLRPGMMGGVFQAEGDIVQEAAAVLVSKEDGELILRAFQCDAAGGGSSSRKRLASAGDTSYMRVPGTEAGLLNVELTPEGADQWQVKFTIREGR